MQNLEQIRAAKALDTATETSKAAVSKLPAMILANGLLAAAAFASETKKDGRTPRRQEMKNAFDGAAQHLTHPQVGISVLAGCRDTGDLVNKLSAAHSAHLQRATAEVLAFMGYVKRFTTKEGSEEGEDE
jgi:CRISPR/Cas system CMR-associated protein Cmr5 small subunit